MARYEYKGLDLPRTTELLKPLYDYDGVPAEILQAKAEAGTNKHLMVKYFLEGCLDYNSLSDEQKGTLGQFKLFQGAEGTMFDLGSAVLEYQMIHEKLLYGGTPDIIINDQAIIDIKTSIFNSYLHKNVFPLQTAAYERLWLYDIGEKKGKYKHYILYLYPDSYRFMQLKNRQAWSMFKYLLDHYWQQQQFNQKIKAWKGQ